MKKYRILFMILLPFFLILFSYKVNLAFTDYNEDQQSTMDYLNGEQLNLNYTQQEISHLNDVKGVIKGADIVFYILLLAITLLITLSKKYDQLLLYGGISTISVMFLLFLFYIFSFNFL